MSSQTSVNATTTSTPCNLVDPFEDESNVLSDSCQASSAASSTSSLGLAGTNPESFTFRSSLDFTHARRRAASVSTATSYGSDESDDDASETDPFADPPAFRDSLEIVRAHIARKHARAAIESESQTHLLSHKNSLDLPREQRAREVVAKRRVRALKATCHRAGAKAKVLFDSALASVKGVTSH